MVYHPYGQKQFNHYLAGEFAKYLGLDLEIRIVPSLSSYFEDDNGEIVKDSAYTPATFNSIDIACDLLSPVDWRLNKIDIVDVLPTANIVVARKGVDIKGYADLLDPKLKGKIASGDPTKSSSAWAELTNMLLVKGDEPYDEKAWEWVNTFAKNLNGVIIDGSSAIYKGTYEGEYVVGVSYEDPCVGLLVDQAAAGKETVRLVYPSEGAVWLPAGTAIIKNAPNMENAKLFMDWLISDEGQKEIAKTTARPVNPNIANTSELMTPFSQINVKYENMELCGSHKKEWQTRWTEMFNASKQ